LLILVANAVVSIWQDSNADNALEALKSMQAVECKLLRGREWTIQDSKNLVPGDVVEVKIGDRVPADVRIAKLVSISLQVDQAPLTGETVSV
jgi:Ca2+-transporting ATPase